MAALYDLNKLHQRMLAGDSQASHDVVQALLEPLRRRLRARFPALNSDPDLEGFALEALAEYCDRPERFSPDQGNLEAYVWLIARGDVLNSLAKQRKLHLEPLDSEKVAQELDARNTSHDGVAELMGDVPGLPEDVALAEVKARVWGAVQDRDRAVLELMLADEATLENCVAALGLESESPEEQRRQVKQARDRIQAAYRRTREHYRKERGSDG